jgi:hypothetical protein
MLDLGHFFSFIIFLTQSVGLLGWGISPLQGRYLHTEQHKHKRTQTSMPQVGPCLFMENQKFQYLKAFLKIDATTYFLDEKGVLQDYPNKFLARSQCVKYSFKILKF